ncbi:hypothetical protein BJ878DRAFT_415133 [Calycina marina]|uniref:Uncharacterized protein n=1 Tax=Calycina marina TaxID=1763456 RepID=A0A9P7Z8N1_9HELO|nr:hypothetical protein BJ878DRAFT_415133 [Calycina marina]
MKTKPSLRRALLAPPSIRSTMISPQLTLLARRTYLPTLTLTSTTYTTSFWASLIPKPLRTSHSRCKISKPKPKEWNPQTFFIVIFILIGSMSIQMIALKNSFGAFERRANAKIGLLKEIIGRIQKGEEVDVEGLLGTGKGRREAEWEEVLREIEEEDQIWENSRRSTGKQIHEKCGDVPLVGEVIGEKKDKEDVKMKTMAEKPVGKAPSGFY